MSLSAGSTIARASSGSKSCSSSVEPLISANSAVTVLRSPSRISSELASAVRRTGGFFVSAGFPAMIPVSELPQRPQKFSSGSLTAPQLGQFVARVAPHPAQKSRPSRFSRPHFVQRIAATFPQADGQVSRLGSSIHRLEPRQRCDRRQLRTIKSIGLLQYSEQPWNAVSSDSRDEPLG